LYTFNITTGNIIWTKEIWNVHYVTANNDGVYVDRQGQIFAFQPQTGDQLWKKTFYTGHGSLLDIYAKEDVLNVYSGTVVYLLASNTGKEQKRISYDSDLRTIFFRQGDILYLSLYFAVEKPNRQPELNLLAFEGTVIPITHQWEYK